MHRHPGDPVHWLQGGGRCSLRAWDAGLVPKPLCLAAWQEGLEEPRRAQTPGGSRGCSYPAVAAPCLQQPGAFPRAASTRVLEQSPLCAPWKGQSEGEGLALALAQREPAPSTARPALGALGPHCRWYHCRGRGRRMGLWAASPEGRWCSTAQGTGGTKGEQPPGRTEPEPTPSSPGGQREWL